MFSRTYAIPAPDNLADWENARIAELHDLQNRELDQDKRREYVLEAAQILLDELPTIGLYWAERPLFKDNRIKNFHMHQLYYIRSFKYEHVWCDPTCEG